MMNWLRNVQCINLSARGEEKKIHEMIEKVKKRSWTSLGGGSGWLN